MQQASDHAAEKQYRNEDGNQRQCHRNDRETNLLGCQCRGLVTAVAHLHIAHDVFQHDDRVVNNETNAQRERHQRERIQAIAKQVDCRKRADDRKNNRRSRY